MRLEGTLDAFSLPDIFQLLSFTKKTGALHLTRTVAPAGGAQHGVVHVRDGLVTSARADVSRQELSRRLLTTGLVDDEALASAAEELADDPGKGLARLLAEKADLAADVAAQAAADQIADAVFDLLRWPDGDFSFVVDDADDDDLGAQLAVEELVAEGRRRLEAWPGIAEQVPAADAVLRLNPVPGEAPNPTPQEWALLALVDGRRTVGELVALAGRGEFAVVSALSALVGRGLLLVGTSGEDKLLRRHHLLSALEGVPVEVDAAPADAPDGPSSEPSVEPSPQASSGPSSEPSPQRSPQPGAEPVAAAVPVQAPVAPAPARPRSDSPLIPERPEPFTPPRRPDHPEHVPALARASADATVTAIGGHGSVHGATAMQPEAAPGTSPGLVERDPSVNKSLLLRLIAGVRGL